MKQYTVTRIGNTIQFLKECSVSKKPYAVYLSEQQFKDWKDGSLIQNVVPHFTPEEREFLISGLTPKEWDSIMGEEL